MATSKQLTFKSHRGQIDVLSSSDPCQPHSVAGLGAGQEDDRFLWPENFRAVREIQPPYVVNENVDGTIANGVLDLKIDNLEGEGYACQAYCIPAEAVGALHQRERVWLIAYHSDLHRNNKNARDLRGSKEAKQALEEEQHKVHLFGEPVNLWPFDSYADTERPEEQHHASESGIFSEGLSRYFGFGPDPHGHISRDIIESGIVGMLNGLPEGMDYVGRNQRIAWCGDAIVWQIAYQIFKAIELNSQ